MRHLKVMGLCLAAVFALGAVAVADASAELPAVFECATAAKVGGKYTGKYTEKKCAKEATTKEVEEGKKNKYEWREWDKEPSKAKTFKGKGGSADLAVQGSVTVTCAKSSDSGKFTGPKTAGDVVAIFSGCEVAGIKCENTSKAGEIKTNPLDGEVGYIEGAGTGHPVVGADLKPESSPYFAEFECKESPFPLRLRTGGSVIGEVTPVNTLTKEATFHFREAGGKQIPEEFEGGLPDTLITGTCKGVGCTPNGEDPSAEETTVTNKGEELELKA